MGPSWFCQTISQARLCGFGTRVSLSDVDLSWSSWSLLQCLQKWSMASKWESFAPVIVHISNSSLSLPCLFVVCVLRRMQNFSTLVPKIKCGDSVNAKTSIQRDNFRFCWAVWCWNLFHTHPTYKNKCSTSEDTQNSLRGWFRIFKVSSKVWVLEQSQSTMLRRITQMAKLSVITCVMKVRDQTSQAFVTSSCDSSCKNSQTASSSSLLKLWSSKRRVETIVQLVSLCINQFTISSDTLFRMTFHVIRLSSCSCVRFLPPKLFFELLQEKFLIRTSSCIPQWYSRSICIRVEYIPSTHGQEMMSVLPDQSISSMSST